MTGCLTFLLTLLAFLAVDGSRFFAHWSALVEAEMAAEGAQFGFAGAFVIRIFQFMAALLAVVFLLVTVGYVRRTFTQFFMMQQAEIHTMCLLGESDRLVNTEFALQPVYFFFITSLLAVISTQFLFGRLLSDGQSLGNFADVIKGFTFPYMLDFIIIIGGSGYLFMRIFSFMKKIEEGAKN